VYVQRDVIAAGEAGQSAERRKRRSNAGASGRGSADALTLKIRSGMQSDARHGH